MTTRRELLETHSNDYGFDVSMVLAEGKIQNPVMPLSIVIPYFDTGPIFERCLYFLSRAIDRYGGPAEVIIVDDGSKRSPLVTQLKSSKVHIHSLRTITFEKNRGRTEARNAGLHAAMGEIILFIDSDILVDETLIISHMVLHTAGREHNHNSIVVSFFEFIKKNDPRIMKEQLRTDDLNINDFRIDCTYEASWIGCEQDKQYINQHMRLVDDTNGFRTWHGQHKAWMLPNMILGGAFSVIKSEMIKVGGFDSRFKGYGFTETSAVTRMVAEGRNVVIPSITGGALHVEDEDVNVSLEEKDRIFKQKHDFYFNTFLMEEVA